MGLNFISHKFPDTDLNLKGNGFKKIRLCVIVILLWIEVPVSSYSKESVKDYKVGVTISRNLYGAGFHRKIETTVSFTKSTLDSVMREDCHFLLNEILPPGLYADPFQLKSLEAFGGPKVLFSSEVDLEAPAYKSNALDLKIYFDLLDAKLTARDIWEIKIELPVHARYHQPSETSSAASISIHQPALYTTCHVPGSNSKELLLAPCALENSTECSWKFLVYNSELDYLQMQVPVASVKDQVFVVLITIIVTLVISIKLINKLTYKMNIKHDKKR